MKNIYPFVLSLVCLMLSTSALSAQHGKHSRPSCCLPGGDTATAMVQLGDMKVPNVAMRNQDGSLVHFYDLIQGKTVAINFVFTTCKTICPPMGANFAKVQQLMGRHPGTDLAMISISLDPATDTPERLKSWQEKFNPGPGWTMLTGDKPEVDKLLKALKVFTAVKEEHAPVMLIGKDGDENWIRTNGLAEPEKIAEIINGYLPKPEPEVLPADPDQAYFTDTKLQDQNGIEHRFYSDLMKDKIVVINAFFSECTGTCPIMATHLKEIQTYLGDRLGREVVLLSISVDCTKDTPTRLKEYAEHFEARPGWYFLTGSKENVDKVLKKVGQYAETREAHKTIMMIGNVRTRLWKKADGMAASADIFSVLESVVNDQN